MRESASIYIIKEIIRLGGRVKAYDPKAMYNAKEHYFKGLNNIIYCIISFILKLISNSSNKL